MIRPGTIYDLPQITIVRTSMRENHLSVAQLAERGITEQLIAAEMVSGDLGCWVAEAQGTVVGFSMADRYKANIFALFVLPDHEGHGHGSALLSQCETWLKSHRSSEANLCTD
jgi:GNAT superfamily N-acetyltransferase